MPRRDPSLSSLVTVLMVRVTMVDRFIGEDVGSGFQNVTPGAENLSNSQ